MLWGFTRLVIRATTLDESPSILTPLSSEPQGSVLQRQCPMNGVPVQAQALRSAVAPRAARLVRVTAVKQ